MRTLMLAVLPIFLVLTMLVVRRISRRDTISSSAAMLATLLAALAVALSFRPEVCQALWLGVFSVGGVLLDFVGADHLASRAFFGLTRAIRGLPWPLNSAIRSVPSMALALAVAFAVRPLIAANAQQRLAQLLPSSLRRLVTNGWSTERAAWRENAAILILCLVPILGVGIIAAIYLRLKRPDRLWPLTWAGAVLALGSLVSSLTSLGLWKLRAGIGLKYFQMLPLVTGVAVVVSLIVSSAILAATMPSAPPAYAAERAFKRILMLHMPFFLLTAWWVFVIAMSY